MPLPFPFPVLPFSPIFEAHFIRHTMNIPEGLKYTKDHEWIKIEGNIATVGITEFAQRELGDIVFVDISSTGQNMSVNEVFGTVEAVKTVSDLFLPVSGTINEVNPALESNPEY